MTMKAKHTPGPWELSFESVDPEWAIIQTKGGAIVANVNADHRQASNARLIAAAPDMFDALEYIKNCNMTNAQDFKQVAIAAIEKARGE